MPQQFFVRSASKPENIQGPFPLAKIKSLIQRGKIRETHQISSDQVEWLNCLDWKRTFINRKNKNKKAASSTDNVVADEGSQEPTESNTEEWTRKKVSSTAGTGSTARRYIYCRIGDEVIGPVSVKQARGLATTGTLNRDDEVRVEEDGEWVPAHEKTQIFGFMEWPTAPTDVEPQEEPDIHAIQTQLILEGVIDADVVANVEFEEKKRKFRKQKELERLESGEKGDRVSSGKMMTPEQHLKEAKLALVVGSTITSLLGVAGAIILAILFFLFAWDGIPFYLDHASDWRAFWLYVAFIAVVPIAAYYWWLMIANDVSQECDENEFVYNCFVVSGVSLLVFIGALVLVGMSWYSNYQHQMKPWNEILARCKSIGAGDWIDFDGEIDFQKNILEYHIGPYREWQHSPTGELKSPDDPMTIIVWQETQHEIPMEYTDGQQAYGLTVTVVALDWPTEKVVKSTTRRFSPKKEKLNTESQHDTSSLRAEVEGWYAHVVAD